MYIQKGTKMSYIINVKLFPKVKSQECLAVWM